MIRSGGGDGTSGRGSLRGRAAAGSKGFVYFTRVWFIGYRMGVSK